MTRCDRVVLLLLSAVVALSCGPSSRTDAPGDDAPRFFTQSRRGVSNIG